MLRHSREKLSLFIAIAQGVWKPLYLLIVVTLAQRKKKINVIAFYSYGSDNTTKQIPFNAVIVPDQEDWDC